MLPNPLQHTKQPPRQKLIWPKVSIVPRLTNPALDTELPVVLNLGQIPATSGGRQTVNEAGPCPPSGVAKIVHLLVHSFSSFMHSFSLRVLRFYYVPGPGASLEGTEMP